MGKVVNHLNRCENFTVRRGEKSYSIKYKNSLFKIHTDKIIQTSKSISDGAEAFDIFIKELNAILH